MKRFTTLFGCEGVTTDEKDVFIRRQNSIVCSKASVLLNCLNTFDDRRSTCFNPGQFGAGTKHRSQVIVLTTQKVS